MDNKDELDSGDELDGKKIDNEEVKTNSKIYRTQAKEIMKERKKPKKAKQINK